MSHNGYSGKVWTVVNVFGQITSVCPQNVVQNAEEPFTTVQGICQLAYKHKSVFPGVYKCNKLLLTAPVPSIVSLWLDFYSYLFS